MLQRNFPKTFNLPVGVKPYQADFVPFRGKSMHRRFWEKVDVCAPDECWEWLGAKDGAGYGDFKYWGRQTKATRVMWHYMRGFIPNDGSYHGYCVLHKCDNPGCVNPDHLFLGTHAENMRDRDNKGRQAKGSEAGRTKLTEADVARIRDLRGKETTRVTAERFGISHAYVSAIRHGRAWAHLE